MLTFGTSLHTWLVFPRRHSIVEKHPRLIPVVYLAPYGLFLIYMIAMRLTTADYWNWLGYWNAGEWTVATIYVALLVVVAVSNYRASRDDAAVRIQFRWVLFAMLLSSGSIFFLWLLPGAFLGRSLVPAPVLALLGLPVPLGMAIAILRYRLFDIELIINRALIYGTLTISTMAIYIFIVGYVGDLFQTRDRTVLAFIATGLVAVLFQPLRERLQRLINHWMYGERDDPYAALARLGRQLEDTATPEAILPAIVDAIANALKLPYVAVALVEDQEMVINASVGQPISGAELTRLPLIHQNDEFGQLILAPRAAGESFTTAELRLLNDLARQVEVAAHNVRLTSDLQKSRERIVTAREEERRHIRRELHDGLGPSLASLTLRIDAARNLLRKNPRAADDLLLDLKSQMQASMEDIRRLAYTLRPPALDELGLLSAIREACTGQERLGLSVIVETPEKVPPLSAAVEVATYRIVCEALTNVSKHAQATECHVRLMVNDDMQIDVQDNGIGLQPGKHSGVGMFSMRERAAELGGTFSIHSNPGGGVHIKVHLPCEVSNDEI
jgi:signal transduction histidine kinase